MIIVKLGDICFPTANIFPAVLSLYMDDRAQGLPVGNEVLVCTSKTTSEEVTILKIDNSAKKVVRGLTVNRQTALKITVKGQKGCFVASTVKRSSSF